MTKLRDRRSAVIIACILIAPPSLSAEVEYEISVGVSRSDNVARTDSAEIEETIAVAGLQLDVKHESRRLDASVLTDLEYRNYNSDIFDDEVVGSLNADLEFQIAPDVLSWVVQDRFGKLQSNPFEANTPINRENINRFSTGPELRIRMGSVTSIELGGRFHANNFELSDIDSEESSGRLSFIRALSAHRTLSLNLSADRIEFDNSVSNSNYDRQTAFVGFQSEISRGSLIVNLGYNELHDDGEVVDGNLISVEWIRDISASTSLKLAYNQSLSDASDSFDRNQVSGPSFGDIQQTPGVSDPFENKELSGLVDFSRGGNNFFVSASYNEDEYLTLGNLDRSRLFIRAGVSRVFAAAWRFNLQGSLEKTDFDVSERKDDDLTARIGLSRQISRTISVNIDLVRVDRDSTDSAFDYVENTVNLTFNFAR